MDINISKYWSIFHDNKKKMLYNYIKKAFNYVNIDEYNYILILKHDLKDIILNNNNWGLSSKETLLSVVYKWLLINNDIDTANDFFNEYVKIKQLRDYERGKNTQDNNEQKKYKNINYFIKILDKLNFEKLCKLDHMKYLLLSLLVYQPPLRTSFYNTVKFITNISDNNKINNYILIDNDNDIIRYIINKDKISYCNNKHNIIDINNNTLKYIIKYSYNKYKRDYVLINQWNKNISQNTVLIWLKEFTKSDINVNMLRSSYINNEYSNKLNYNEKNELAKQMRHSVNAAIKDYVKNDI
jgi:integrase